MKSSIFDTIDGGHRRMRPSQSLSLYSAHPSNAGPPSVSTPLFIFSHAQPQLRSASASSPRDQRAGNEGAIVVCHFRLGITFYFSLTGVHECMRTIKYANARQCVYKQTHTWLNLHVALDATVTAPQW